jgi:hypothetical protein
MCTATDLAVLCGTNGEVCYSKYEQYLVKKVSTEECVSCCCLSCNFQFYCVGMVPTQLKANTAMKWL